MKPGDHVIPVLVTPPSYDITNRENGVVVEVMEIIDDEYFLGKVILSKIVNDIGWEQRLSIKYFVNKKSNNFKSLYAKLSH